MTRCVVSIKTLDGLKKTLRECKKRLVYCQMDQMYRATDNPSLTNFCILSYKCDISYLKSRIKDYE